ncbi:MAG: hypothetical protein GX589_01965 [Deltaproteobacteria bacterium]|nr:hypothetical protein [Deltaproteobacteria bacterium]
MKIKEPLSSQTSTRELLLYLVFPLALFVLLVFYLNLDYFRYACKRGGDYHLIALETAKTAHEPVLLGAYSRFGFRHPGPALFYYYRLMSPLVWFAKHPDGAYAFLQFALNLIFLLAALLIVFQNTKLKILTPFLLLIFALTLTYAREGLLLDYWNPSSVVVPGLALFLSCTVIAGGRFESAALAAVALILSLGSHIGTAPVFLPVTLTGVALGLWRLKRRDAPLSLTERGPIFLALVLTATAALPALWEGENLRALLEFGLGAAEPRDKTWLQAIAYVGSFYVEPAGKAYYRHAFFCTGALATLVALLWLMRFETEAFLYRLRILVTVGIFCAVLGALAIRGRPHQYLMIYMYMLTALHYWLLLAGTLLILSKTSFSSRLKNTKIHAAILILYLALAASAWQQNAGDPICIQPQGKLVAKLGLSKDYAYVVKPYNHKLWQTMARIVLDAYRADIDICVPNEWGFMFGNGLVCLDIKGPPSSNVRFIHLHSRHRQKNTAKNKGVVVGDAVVVIDEET